MNFQFPIFKKKLRKLIEIGICVLAFLLPWQTRWIFEDGIVNEGVSEYRILSIFGIDILILSLILLGFFCLKTYKIQYAKYKILLFAFLCWNVFSISWAPNKLLAFQHTSWLLLALGLAWIIIKADNRIRLAFWFVVGLMLTAWLGIFQFVFQVAPANKWLGLAEHDPMLPGTSIVEFYSKVGEPTRWLRAYGSFDHPNIFGTAMAIGLLSSLWFLFERTKDKNEKFLLYLALVSFSAGLFASLSRSAWLGFFFGIVAISIGILQKKIQNNFVEHGKAIFMIIATFVLMVIFYPTQFAMRSGGEGRLEQKSLNERKMYFDQGKEIIGQNWKFGVGAGNYIEALKKSDSTKLVWAYQPVHNVFLLVWAELGIFGMLILMIALTLILWQVWQNEIFAFAMLLAFLPSLMLDHWLWSQHFGLILLGLVVGIMMGFKKDSEFI